MRTVWVSLGERSYPVYIGNNLYPALAVTWREILRPARVLLVSDQNVFPLFGRRIMDELGKAGFDVSPAVVPPGEESKTLETAGSLYTAAIQAGLDRCGLIVALGGGVIGDLAGFTAATLYRGVPFVQVPTTLLAQVDSSVGGKVAVNHALGKNLIGSFYQPKLVWADLATLDSLPRREFLAGAAEVVKYGAIMSEPFFRYLEENWQAFLDREPAVLAETVAACCRLKSSVVAADERETGRRAILNFGHTLGHALEAATAYSWYLHGEAVLAGMVMAVRIAQGKGVLARGEADRLLDVFLRLGCRPAPQGLEAGQVLAAMGQDKKREGEQAVFVLPVKVGETALFSDVEPGLVRAVLEDYLAGKGL